MDQRASHVNRPRRFASAHPVEPRTQVGPGLYLHIPFCLRKCPYCDFFSRPADDAMLSAWPELLIRQLTVEIRTGRWQGPFSTVFFGGGTPSLLAPQAVGRILDRVANLAGLTADAEISLEANPGTLTAGGLQGYRAAGINRLSLGIQSLHDANLKCLGRIHTAADARNAVNWARQAEFDNINCDLIFALPNQSPQAALHDLEALLQLNPQHLSCYGLGIEPDTPFARQLERGEIAPPPEADYAATFCLLHERLAEAGYTHYEISNYARPDRACRHNLSTWRRLPYLGLGPGAHSFCDHDWGERRHVPPDCDAWISAVTHDRDPSERLESFDRRGAMAETAYLGLRCAQGVEDAAFLERFGTSFAEAFSKAIARCGNHLALQQGSWRLDLQGWLLFDHLISGFL